jgi:hypothetical protein
MEEPVVILTLKRKRAEIAGTQPIRHRLRRPGMISHTLMRRSGYLSGTGAVTFVSHSFFKKGEIADICARHLRADREMNTRELAERVMCARNLDPTVMAL